MKKTIQKPENWQDFESLCKKLWGEIWQIPSKIKKNGRNGQSQSGVDIYGIPNKESNYWGIQCKGKDEYTNSKLTIKEINREIEKARLFMPKLSVFIFATTMNKDSEIEEYVRIKDMESRASGGFEILLFCWEDIADLIEENIDTYNYWVANKLHKTQFDIEICFSDFNKEIIIAPICVRTIKRYKVQKRASSSNTLIFNKHPLHQAWLADIGPSFAEFNKPKINEAICSFEIIIDNIGAKVVEDWHVTFTINGEFTELIHLLGNGPMGMIDISELKYSRIHVHDNTITYYPSENEPLIQKANRCFKAYIIPICKEYKIPIEWSLLARDYNSSGTLFLNVVPVYEDEIMYEYVDSEKDIKADEVISIDAKKNYKEISKNDDDGEFILPYVK